MLDEVGVALITKDEEHHIVDCLRSIVDCFAHIVVYDTGSKDSTVRLCERFGVTVVRGDWKGSFAIARNAALQFLETPWVLSLDADERVDEVKATLRDALTENVEGLPFAIRMRCEAHPAIGGTYETWLPRLFLQDRYCWQGRVHERLVERSGAGIARSIPLSQSILAISDIGYLDADTVSSKAQRNLELLFGELEDRGGGVRGDFGDVWFEIGRAYVGLRRWADAESALRRALEGGGSQILQTHDFLAKIALSKGEFSTVLREIDAMKSLGASNQYCSWISAQVHAQLGDTRLATRLLDEVESVIDTAGRDFGAGVLWEMKGLVAMLDGDWDRALESYVVAAHTFGRLEAVEAMVDVLLEQLGPERVQRAFPQLPIRV